MSSTTTLNETLRSPVDYTEFVRLATPGANWKAPLSSIVRKNLLSASNFYISATGSDSNNGLTPATACATTQNVMNILADQYDLGGQNITINIGAGSFAGFGIKSCAGGGNVIWLGAGSASSTITAGPNDGIFNFGENVTFNSVTGGTTHYFSGLTFKNPISFGHFAVYIPYPAVNLANLDGSAADIAFVSATGAPIVFSNGPFSMLFNAITPVTIDRTGSSALFGEFFITGTSNIIILTHIFHLLGSPTYNGAFFYGVDGASMEIPPNISIGGVFTGNVATSFASILDSEGGLLGQAISVQQGGIII